MLREYERTVFGGIGKNDKLIKAARLLETEAEICDAVYWSRLNARLLRLTGRPEYADEIELTLHNVLFGAMNPAGDWGLRRQLLSGEHWPAPPHCRLQHHHCCVANTPRGLLQAAEVAVMGGPQPGDFTVNLYLPGTGTLASAEGRIRWEIHTRYPDDGEIEIRWAAEPARPTRLRARVPEWTSSATVEAQAPRRPRPGLAVMPRWPPRRPPADRFVCGSTSRLA